MKSNHQFLSTNQIAVRISVGLFCLVTLALSIVLLLAAREKSIHIPLSTRPEYRVTIYYCGLDWSDSSGLLGRHYYRIEYANDHFTASIKLEPNQDYHEFCLTDSKSNIRAEGTIAVEFKDAEPSNISEVSFYEDADTAIYYMQDGTIAGRVDAGDGTVRFDTEDGTLVENVIQGHKRAKCRAWYPNGTLKSEATFSNGLLHGKSFFYSEMGDLILVTRHDHGELLEFNELPKEAHAHPTKKSSTLSKFDESVL